MKLIGVKVFHEKYGHGKIVEASDNKVGIKFAKQNSIKIFLYPDSFGVFMSTKDKIINKHIKKKKLDETKNKRSGRVINKNVNFVPDSIFFTVYTYKSRSLCSLRKHDRNAVVAIVQSLNNKQQFEIDINYCANCEAYYISETSLSVYEERFGILLLKRIPEEQNSVYVDEHEWKEKSELAMFGYSAKDGGLSSKERQFLLSEIVRTKSMTKIEIKEWIEFLIMRSSNQVKYHNASIKWKEDLNFINDYDTKEEKKINGNLKQHKSR